MKFIVTAHGLNITKAQILNIQFYWFSTPCDANRAAAVIEKLDPGTKTKIFDIIDTYLRDFKTRQAYMA